MIQNPNDPEQFSVLWAAQGFIKRILNLKTSSQCNVLNGHLGLTTSFAILFLNGVQNTPLVGCLPILISTSLIIWREVW